MKKEQSDAPEQRSQTTVSIHTELPPVEFKSESAFEFFWIGMRWITVIGLLVAMAIVTIGYLAELLKRFGH